jgi:polar amino acid transport system permease protein
MQLVVEYLPILLRGAWTTVELTLSSTCLAILMSFISGLAALSKRRALRWTSQAYVVLFQGTSLLVQLFWAFYILPLFGITLQPFVVAVLGFGLNLGAYGSEVVRGAIQGVPSGQTDAAVALCFSPFQRFRIVILPQALKLMVLPFGTLLIVLLKATSLASLITIHELTFHGELLRRTTGDTITILFLVMLIYFAISSAISFAIGRLDKVGTRSPAMAALRRSGVSI